VKLIAAAIGLVLLAFAGEQTVHRGRIDRLVSDIDKDAAAVAAKLAEQSPGRDCRGAPQADEFERLARSLFTVESIAASWSERSFETTLTKAALALDMPVPDMSIGPGQIKPSTLKKALPDIARKAEWAGEPFSGLAGHLLEDCTALPIAAAIIQHHFKALPDEDGLLGRKEVMRIAELWNGQEKTLMPAGLVANARYKRLVYLIVLNLRFDNRDRHLPTQSVVGS